MEGGIAVIRTLAIGHAHEVIAGIPLQNIDVEKYAWIWVDFKEPSEEETKLLDSYFHFHPLAIEDCMHVLQRPKLDHYPETEFMVVHALREHTLEVEEVGVFMEQRVLVTYHHAQLDEVDRVWDRVADGHANTVSTKGPLAAAYEVLDELVDQYFPCVYAIEDELAELENQSGNESVELLMTQVFQLRSRLLKIRRTVVPMRDLLYRIINSGHVQGAGEYKAYFTDIYDHLLKLADMIEADREMTADLRDGYISLNSNRMNSIMKTLTVITTIFMPLTLIAGIYGMNFVNMPELHWNYGYAIVMVVMVAMSVGMVLWFSRRGWFK